MHKYTHRYYLRLCRLSGQQTDDSALVSMTIFRIIQKIVTTTFTDTAVPCFVKTVSLTQRVVELSVYLRTDEMFTLSLSPESVFHLYL